MGASLTLFNQIILYNAPPDYVPLALRSGCNTQPELTYTLSHTLYSDTCLMRATVASPAAESRVRKRIDRAGAPGSRC